MPAITLGLAEVEERLQALRGRLNSRTAQHGIYVVSATAVLLSAVLIVAGLRGSPATFRVVVGVGAIALLVVALASSAYAWKRWTDLHSVARLVDSRAQLTDRLTTLVDLRLRQRPSRLAPVLVAQVLALGDRWQPHRIVPRRVPRSVFLLVAALLALASTTVLERQARRAEQPESPPPQPVAQDTAAAAPQRSMGEVPRAAARADHAGTRTAGDTSRAGTFPGSGSEASATLAGRSDSTSPSGEVREGPASLTDRLQQAIADTFRADKPDAREPRRGREGGTAGAVAQTRADADLQRRTDTSTRGAAPEQGRGTGGSATGTASASAPHAAQRPAAASGPQKFTGDSPGAGEGSSPNGLLQGTAAERGDDAPASSSFTLTITSVPRAREARGTAADRGTTGSGVPSLAAAAANSPSALNERQLGDDALRKAEIPPEYEDVIRGVFTARAER